MRKKFFTKITKKDIFYWVLIFILTTLFLGYNLRIRLLESDIGQQITKIKDNIFLNIHLKTTKSPSLPSTFKNRTLKELKEFIVSEVPILEREDATDFEKVSAIREWVFDSIPVVQEPLLIGNIFDEYYSKIPLTKRIEIFHAGLAGAWCGATATTLRDIYELFGYKAYTVNQGNAAIADTHVITLVKIFHDRSWIYSVQDAYLNYSLVDKSENPMGYFGALALIRTKNTDEVLYKWGERDGRYDKPHLFQDETDSSKVIKVFPNGNVLQRQYFQGYFDLLERTEPLLAAHNYPRELIYFYLSPFAIDGKNDEKAKTLLTIAKSVSGTFCESKVQCDPKDHAI